MANVGIAVAAIAAITIVSGGQTVAEVLDPGKADITHHARLATVATERELDQLAPGAG